MSAADLARPERSRSTRRSERLAAIVELLGEHGSVQIADLSLRLGVSEATLRRDLALLEEQHRLTRTHGGALAQDAGFDLPARRRGGPEANSRRAIAAAAARRVPDGAHVVGLTGAGATGQVARLLAGRPDLTVVTNALDVAMDLAPRSRLKLIVVGGACRPDSFQLAGPWAEEVLSSVNIGTAFVGVDGITAEGGLTAEDEIGARTQRAMLARAARVVAVAEGGAVGRVTLARTAGLDGVHELITDSSAPAGAVQAIRSAGVPVTIADGTGELSAHNGRVVR